MPEFEEATNIADRSAIAVGRTFLITIRSL